MAALNNIGIVDNGKSFVASIGSFAGVGKTTIMVSIASRLVNEGKNILFISEDSTSNIIRKSVEFRFIDSKTNGKFMVIGKFYDVSLLSRVIDGREIDYVFLDSYVFNDKENITNAINFIRAKNISTFVSVQLKKIIEPLKYSDSLANEILQYTDYVYVLSKKEKLSFWEKVKYWIKFADVPNFNLNLIKSRYGKNKKFDFHINLNKLK